MGKLLLTGLFTFCWQTNRRSPAGSEATGIDACKLTKTAEPFSLKDSFMIDSVNQVCQPQQPLISRSPPTFTRILVFISV